MKKSAWLFACIFLSFTSNISNTQTNNYSQPQTMIRLCSISYITDSTDRKAAVKNAVKQQLGMEVVWGPVELIDDFGLSYSSMYVAYNELSKNYTVVIRGTNYESLKSWIGEDFQVHKAVKFSKFIKNATVGSKISKGTCNGMEDLNKLKDNGTTVVTFLKNAYKTKPMNGFYVTGHSLGGTLTPPFYAYLCHKVFGGVAPANIKSSPYSFAGLTAGNDSFNVCLKTYLQNDSPWRYVNPLDLAPNLWDASDATISNMYIADSLTYGFPESDLVGYLLHRARPNNYLQPSGSKFQLPSIFNSTQNTWISQAEYQHHSTTYISLIDSCCAKQ